MNTLLLASASLADRVAIVAQLEVLDIELTADISDAIKAVDAAKAILLERQAHRDDLYAQHSAISAAIAELRAFDDSMHQVDMFGGAA